MAEKITLPLRPGQTVRFPAACVACGQPADEHLTISKRQGQTERSMNVPVCADCLHATQRRSGREETLVRVGWLAAAAGALLGFTLVWLLTGDMLFWERLASSLIAAAVAAGLAFWSFRRAAQAAELPEKRAVTEAAQISEFSWRDVTLTLANAALAERVLEMNTLAPEASPGDQNEPTEQQTLVEVTQ